MAGKFAPEDDMNVITLNFSTYIVTLKGYGPDSLFTALLDHLPRQVAQTDPRYIKAEHSLSILVKMIEVKTIGQVFM